MKNSTNSEPQTPQQSVNIAIRCYTVCTLHKLQLCYTCTIFIHVFLFEIITITFAVVGLKRPSGAYGVLTSHSCSMLKGLIN